MTDSPPPDGLELIEHQPTYETRQQRKKGDFGTFYEIPVHRFVCTCEHRTTWNEDLEAAKRASDRHALPGQLGFDVA